MLFFTTLGVEGRRKPRTAAISTRLCVETFLGNDARILYARVGD